MLRCRRQMRTVCHLMTLYRTQDSPHTSYHRQDLLQAKADNDALEYNIKDQTLENTVARVQTGHGTASLPGTGLARWQTFN